MDTNKMELKTSMTAAEAAEYLASLAKAFKAGKIVVEKGEERLELCPAPDLPAEVEVEARRKKDKARFSLEITWRLAEAVGEDEALRISAGDAPAKTPDEKPAKKPEEKSEAPKETKKSEPAKPEGAKPVTTGASAAPAAPAAAAAGAKSGVKPAASAAHEPGGKTAAASAAPAKPKQ